MGAWQNIRFLRRYTNGAWQDCSFCRKYYNGAWQNVYPEPIWLFNNGDYPDSVGWIKTNGKHGSGGTAFCTATINVAGNNDSLGENECGLRTGNRLDVTPYTKLSIYVDCAAISSYSSSYSDWWAKCGCISFGGLDIDTLEILYVVQNSSDLGWKYVDITGYTGYKYISVFGCGMGGAVRVRYLKLE